MIEPRAMRRDELARFKVGPILGDAKLVLLAG